MFDLIIIRECPCHSWQTERRCTGFIITQAENMLQITRHWSVGSIHKFRGQKEVSSKTFKDIFKPFDFAIDETWSTGCPAKLFTLGYLLFCGLLLMQTAKNGTFLKNSGNLLHDRHKNFENRFRNS